MKQSLLDSSVAKQQVLSVYLSKVYKNIVQDHF